MGPISPVPMLWLSIRPTGVRWAAVPVRKHSSEVYSSLLRIPLSMVSIPSSFFANSAIVVLVIPDRILSVMLGVTNLPFEMTNRFSPVPSDTYPSWVSNIASSNPARVASVFARIP